MIVVYLHLVYYFIYAIIKRWMLIFLIRTMFQFPERIILEAFQYAELADKKPNPNMLIELYWEEVKTKVQLAIDNYLRNAY